MSINTDFVNELENKVCIDNKRSFIGKAFNYVKDYLTGNRITDILKNITQNDLIKIHDYEIKNIKKAYSKEKSNAICKLIEKTETEIIARQLFSIHAPPSKAKNSIEENSKEIVNFLKFHTDKLVSSKAFEKAYQKYGSKITDPVFLLSEIEKIQDPKVRKLACKYLFTFQIKLLGHEIGMGGKIKLNQKNLDIEAIYNEITVSEEQIDQYWKIDSRIKEVRLEGYNSFLPQLKLLHSLKDFFSDFPGVTDSSFQQSTIHSLESTIYASYFVKAEEHLKKFNFNLIVKDIQTDKTVVLPVGWYGHKTTIVISKDKLAYANRGQKGSPDTNLGIQIYSIGNKDAIDEEFLKRVILNSLNKEKTKQQMDFLENKDSQYGMHKRLKLQPIHFIEKKAQKIGNCSWASAKCAFQAQLFMHEYEKISQDTKVEKEILIKQATEKANQLYKTWNIYLRKSEFLNFIDFLKKNNEGYQIFSKQEELRLMSQFFDKFYTINKKEKYHAIVKEAGQAMQDLALSFFEEKDYSIEEGIVLLNEIKDPEKRKLVPDKTLDRKLPGSFMITQETKKGELKIFYRKQRDQESPIETFSENITFRNGSYYIGKSNKPLKSMSELREFIKKELIKSEDCVPVPILNQNIIDRTRQISMFDKFLQYFS